ncbi:MAG: serine/threonine protein kinase [Polyangiaceae bacterium]|nr:serine/threonine protein kinase [Polyangiaceae bacterium]
MLEPLIGKVIAQRYRLISQLGSGGSASVFLARHVVIDRLCAIKVFRPRPETWEPAPESTLRPEGTHPDAASLRERFLREARAVNRVHHPNIVEITDYGEAADLVYLVMEYVPGEPLSRVLTKGVLPWRTAARIGVQIASALERAHEMGVIHRDLKPANVLVLPKKDGDYVVKLADFGVAQITDEPRLTETTSLVGTPGYMAPEYQQYGRFDRRSDLYSLGVLLFETVTGRLPIEFKDDVLTAQGHLNPALSQALFADPPSVRSITPEVAPFFDDVVKTLLAPDPDDRPRDAFEACDLLERALATTPRASVVPSERSPNSPRASSAPPSEPGARASIPSDPLGKRPGPRLLTAPHSRVLPICLAALERITQAFDAKSASAEERQPLAIAEKQVAMVGRIARLVESDAQEENALRAEARALHTELGRQLDDAARERSRTLGWAGTAAERAYQVKSRLELGEDPIPTMEAMLWERAALDAAEAEAHQRAEELSAEIQAIQSELSQRTERIEDDLAVVTARLWGRVGALRAMALEAWMDLEAAATAAGLPPEELSAG